MAASIEKTTILPFDATGFADCIFFMAWEEQQNNSINAHTAGKVANVFQVTSRLPSRSRFSPANNRYKGPACAESGHITGLFLRLRAITGDNARFRAIFPLPPCSVACPD